MKNKQQTKIESLYKAVLKLETPLEVERFFNDLLTSQEIIEFSNRWHVAQLLASKMSYSAIEKETGMSSTTIARISKYLKGKFGGYQLAINKSRANNSAIHHTPA